MTHEPWICPICGRKDLATASVTPLLLGPDVPSEEDGGPERILICWSCMPYYHKVFWSLVRRGLYERLITVAKAAWTAAGSPPGKVFRIPTEAEMRADAGDAEQQPPKRVKRARPAEPKPLPPPLIVGEEVDWTAILDAAAEGEPK